MLMGQMFIRSTKRCAEAIYRLKVGEQRPFDTLRGSIALPGQRGSLAVLGPGSDARHTLAKNANPE
jgi:hypothetical protein